VKSNDVCLVPACKTVSLPALPCSVLLHDFAQNSHAEGSDRYPTLLAGLTDGTLASFAFKDNELRDQKIISLGDAPVNMAACAGDSRRTVFVCGSRASVLFRDKERLNNSPILLKVSFLSLS
jgi:DNA damage-binding protein 1